MPTRLIIAYSLLSLMALGALIGIVAMRRALAKKRRRQRGWRDD